MAVVKAPLFSLDASGGLAGAIVFFPYKGQKCVRSLVDPANPNTAAQQTVRTRMSDAVDGWHTIGYTAADVADWNRFATASYPKQSGYNTMVSHYCRADKLGYDLDFPYDCIPDHTVAGTITIDFKGKAGETYYGRIGTSKTSQLTEVAASDLGGGAFDIDFTGLTAGVQYYMYVFQDATGRLTRSGLITDTAT